jgi:phytoene dehydrogenase-like protein
LLALVPVGHLDDGAVQDWDGWQAQARAAVLRRLAAVGVADLDRHTTIEITYTPRDWCNLYNLARGAAFSLSHNALQVGYLRPHNRHLRYGNLYFVGGSTHPGSGLPMVLLSARLTTERILRDNKTADRVRRSAWLGAPRVLCAAAERLRAKRDGA